MLAVELPRVFAGANMTYANVDLVLLVGVHIGGCRGLWCCGSQVTFLEGQLLAKGTVSCRVFVVRTRKRVKKSQFV
jgi:hypothetical protein